MHLLLYCLPLLPCFQGGPGDASERSAPGGGGLLPETSAADAASTSEAALVARGMELLLERQESLTDAGEEAEWPYEGVYREAGQIPIGYRIGGTAIAAWALLETPGYAGSEAAAAAVERGLRFVLDGLAEEAMASGFRGRYDVRGWGHTYALTLLLRMRALERVPAELEERVGERVSWLVQALAETEIPESGGWNYSRRKGFEGSRSASPFMTAPTVLALWEAQRQGIAVDADVVERALAALESCRIEGGALAYASGSERSTLPGSIARLPVTEVVLGLAGRSSEKELLDSVRFFFEHWNELEKRRAKTGTHVAPHGVAPYYFFYGHYYASVAIEMLPTNVRAEWRARYLETLLSVRGESGGWNDRVFPRSEAFGTAMAMLSILEPGRPRPQR